MSPNDPARVQRILVGTRNANKLREIRQILAHLPVELFDLTAVPEAPEVVEDGETFEANAVKKARTLADFTGHWVIADDSGLEAHALDGRPGVLSARYAGPDATDARNNEKLLRELAAASDRSATFRCVIALARPDELLLVAHGHCDGVLREEPAGHNGFGYDPLFFWPALQKTFAQLAPEEKNRISHRGRALAELARGLESLLER